MTQPDLCPPAGDFQAMLLGRLDEPCAAVLEAHLETCPACQQVLDGLAVDARLTDALRQAPAPLAEAVPPLGMETMMARLKDMAHQFTPSGFDLHPSAAPIPGTEGWPADSPDQPGTLRRMGAYRILRLLGAGGMGLVYLAEDEVLHRRVAVKVLRPRLARVRQAREGFLREARAMAALKHDNVVTVFQVGEAEGPGGGVMPFLAMELLEGMSVADWLRMEGPVSAAWAARLGRQAADGLAQAHVRGVVHRDIKPGNLWLEAPHGWGDLPSAQRPPLPSVARVKVLDFGLAQPAGEDGFGVDGPVLGTPAYMAPEQASGRVADHRADLFSLGVVLYELLTARVPFPRQEQRASPTYPPPVPILDLVPTLPPNFAALIHRLLAPRPAGRPASAREVNQELALFAVPAADETVPVAAGSTRPVPIRRRWRMAAAVGALVVLALAMGTWLAIRPRTSPAEPPLPPLPELLIQPGPPDDEWARTVASVPVERQPAVVLAKLRELNPGYDGKVARFGIENGVVTDFSILTDDVRDIRPLRAFTGLKSLSVIGNEPGKGKLTDLSPIRGLPLTTLNVWNNPELADLSAAQGMPLTLFQAGDTAVADLSPLARMPLEILAVNACRVRDLSSLRTMAKVRYLRCDGCPITTLAPLIGSSLQELTFDFNDRRGDAGVLEQMPGLVHINRLTAREFRSRHPAPR